MQSIRAAVPYIQHALNQVFKANDSASLTINASDPPFSKNVKALHNILILIQMSEKSKTASESFAIIAKIYDNGKFISQTDWQNIKVQLKAQQNPSVMMAINQISEYISAVPNVYQKLSVDNIKKAISPATISTALQTISNEMINTVIRMYSLIENQSDLAGSLRSPIKLATDRSGYARLTDDEPVPDSEMQKFRSNDADAPLVKATKLVANALYKFNKIVSIIDGYKKSVHISDTVSMSMVMYDLYQKIEEIKQELGGINIKAIRAEWQERIKINPNNPEKNIFLHDLLKNLGEVADTVESQFGLKSGLLKDAINPLAQSVAEIVSIESKPILLHTQNMIDYVEKALDDLPAPQEDLDAESDVQITALPKNPKKQVTQKEIEEVINGVLERIAALEKLIKNYTVKSPEEQSSAIKDKLKNLNKKLKKFEERFMLLEFHEDKIKALIKLSNKIDKVNEKRPNQVVDKLAAKAKEALTTGVAINATTDKLPALPGTDNVLDAQIIQDPLSSLMQSSDILKVKFKELKAFLQANFDTTNTTTSIGFNVKLLIDNLDKIIAIQKNVSASDLAKVAIDVYMDLQKMDASVLQQIQQAVVQSIPKIAGAVATTTNNALLHLVNQIVQVNSMTKTTSQDGKLTQYKETFNKVRATLAGTQSAAKAIAIINELEKALTEASNFQKFKNMNVIAMVNTLDNTYKHIQSAINSFKTLRPTIGDELFNKIVSENPHLRVINQDIAQIINEMESQLNINKNVLTTVAQQQLTQATQPREMPQVPAVLQENPLLNMIKPIFDMNQQFATNLKEFIESNFQLSNISIPITKNVNIILSILELQQKLVMNVHPADLIAIPVQIFQQAQRLDRSVLIEINKVFQKAYETNQLSSQYKELTTQLMSSFNKVSQAAATLDKSFSMDALTSPRKMKINIYNAYDLLSTMLSELYKIAGINVAPHLEARYQQSQDSQYVRMADDDDPNVPVLPILKSGAKDPPLIIMGVQVLNFLAQSYQSIESGQTAIIHGSKSDVAKAAYAAYSSFKEIKFDEKQMKAIQEEWVKIITECGNDKLQDIRGKFSQIEKALHMLPSSIENMIKPIITTIDQRVTALAAQTPVKKAA